MSRLILTALAVLFLAPAAAANARAIPAFARRYRVSCSLCHNPIPTLTAFGERFAGNGFRFAAAEPARDTVETGDDLLHLARELPLAIRIDAYAQAYANGNAVTDLQLPYNMKILSGGPIAGNLSYYLYFFLFERGEIGGIEDAFVYLNDIGGLPVDLAVGQFQVSDPLFKRELRLEHQDYVAYRARIGNQPADFTYDRGLMLSADVAGFTLTAGLVNGNGREPAGANRRLDNDPNKNFFGHLTRDLIPGVRLGALGYYGNQQGIGTENVLLSNAVRVLGGDVTVSLGPVELNGQYLYRTDDHPTFGLNEAEVTTRSGFGEVILRPAGARWYALGLYNRIDADRPLLDPRMGGAAAVSCYETLTGGAGYLVRRNFRIFTEGTWDLQLKSTVWTVGLTTAF